MWMIFTNGMFDTILFIAAMIAIVGIFPFLMVTNEQFRKAIAFIVATPVRRFKLWRERQAVRKQMDEEDRKQFDADYARLMRVVKDSQPKSYRQQRNETMAYVDQVIADCNRTAEECRKVAEQAGW